MTLDQRIDEAAKRLVKQRIMRQEVSWIIADRFKAICGKREYERQLRARDKHEIEKDWRASLAYRTVTGKESRKRTKR